MNLLFFQDTLGVSGGEIWIADIAGKLQERGHRVFIGCPSGSWMERQAEKHDIPYFDFLTEEEFEGHLHWQLVDTLRQEEIDLICCGIPGMRLEVPLLDRAVREAGRGGILLRLGVSPGPGALLPDRIGLGFETVRGIIVVSEDIKTQLLKAFPHLPPDQVHVLYNGIDLQKFNPSAFRPSDRREYRASLEIPENHRLIGAVGRLDPIKNLSMLVRSAVQVLDRHPQSTFLIAGEGSEKPALIQAAREAGILDNFRFADFVDNIPRLLYSLDILVHTALSEGLPNAVLEAMAMQKPVIATAVGGVPELVEDGKNGILIPSGDVEGLSRELCALHPERMSALGRAARRRAETTFDRGAKLEQLESFLGTEADRSETVSVPQLEGSVELHDLPPLFFERSCTFQKLHR